MKLSFFLGWVLGSLLSYLLYILGYNFAIYFCYLSYSFLKGAGRRSGSKSVFSLGRDRSREVSGRRWSEGSW